MRRRVALAFGGSDVATAAIEGFDLNTDEVPEGAEQEVEAVARGFWEAGVKRSPGNPNEVLEHRKTRARPLNVIREQLRDAAESLTRHQFRLTVEAICSDDEASKFHKAIGEYAERLLAEMKAKREKRSRRKLRLKALEARQERFVRHRYDERVNPVHLVPETKIGLTQTVLADGCADCEACLMRHELTKVCVAWSGFNVLQAKDDNRIFLVDQPVVDDGDDEPEFEPRPRTTRRNHYRAYVRHRLYLETCAENAARRREPEPVVGEPKTARLYRLGKFAV